MNSPALRTPLLLAGLVAASACASGGVAANGGAPQPQNSATAPPIAGQQNLLADRLVFGRNIPTGGQVSDADWDVFLRDVITPAFPSGLTLWHAEGQWLDPRGTLVKEPTIVIEVLHPAGAPSDSVFARIANEYRRRFHQDAVLRETIAARTWLYEAPIRPAP